MTEKISVIIPVYNVENQLQTCLDSVLGQTYQNLEIILINYGSTDNSDAICRSYVARDSRILYFKKDNGGFQMLAILVFVRLRELTSPMWMLRIG